MILYCSTLIKTDFHKFHQGNNVFNETDPQTSVRKRYL